MSAEEWVMPDPSERPVEQPTACTHGPIISAAQALVQAIDVHWGEPNGWSDINDDHEALRAAIEGGALEGGTAETSPDFEFSVVHQAGRRDRAVIVLTNGITVAVRQSSDGVYIETYGEPHKFVKHEPLDGARSAQVEAAHGDVGLFIRIDKQ